MSFLEISNNEHKTYIAVDDISTISYIKTVDMTYINTKSDPNMQYAIKGNASDNIIMKIADEVIKVKNVCR